MHVAPRIFSATFTQFSRPLCLQFLVYLMLLLFKNKTHGEYLLDFCRPQNVTYTMEYFQTLKPNQTLKVEQVCVWHWKSFNAQVFYEHH